MGEEIFETYDPEEFLDDVVDFAMRKIYQVNPIEQPQRLVLWDRLIRELEKERDGI